MEGEADHITAQYSLYPPSPQNSSTESDSPPEMEHPKPIHANDLPAFVPGENVVPHPDGFGQHGIIIRTP